MIDLSDVAFVITSCDKYSHLWEGWYHYFNKYVDSKIKCPIYFISETIKPQWNDSRVTPVTQTNEYWTNRLSDTLLFKIMSNYKYIFLMQEDMWPKECLSIDLLRAVKMMHVLQHRNCSHIAPRSNMYNLEQMNMSIADQQPENIYKFTHESNYLINHTPGLWTRRFLELVLQNPEDPWTNEKEQTIYWRHHMLDPIVYLHHYDWYENVSRRGKVTDKGKEMMEAMNASG